MKKTTNLTISEEIRDAAKAYCASQSFSVSEVVEDLLADFIWRKTGVPPLVSKYPPDVVGTQPQLAAATVEAGAALAAVKRGRGRPRKFKAGELPAAP